MSAADVRETEQLKGYASLDEFRRRREEMQQHATLSSLHATVASAVGLPTRAGAEARVDAGEGGADSTGADGAGTKKKRKKGKGAGGVGLSFDDGVDDDTAGADARSAAALPAGKRVFKAPGVDTSFLAKNSSEKEDEARRQQTRLREILDAQEREKNEEVELHYAFRNEHAKKLLNNPFYRGHVRVRRGDTVGAVLERVHAKLSAELAEKVSSQLLLAVSNDYVGIVTQAHMSLYDTFALEWAEGGLMFELGKSQVVITERAFLEANKHLHPMNGWALFDPFKKYSHDVAVRNREKSTGVEVQRAKGGGAGKR
ncbi:hypothetical protein KFE25_007351 [Diacronema lutheri]|uniref:Uncharacterized protein n=1 Tax=Diacronema lutheri TaxID=2081491 RepID=A0A8J6CII0_DIALT|nr:hypothetical protein KFE25_007351 [Diacronema lutheri]